MIKKLLIKMLLIAVCVFIFLAIPLNIVNAININGSEIASMPDLADWIKKNTNSFFNLETSSLLGKSLYQGRGNVGAVESNNGMCLYHQNSNNPVDTYKIYTLVDIEYQIGTGYTAKVNKIGDNNKITSKTENVTDIQTELAKLVRAFQNTKESKVTGCTALPGLIRKNEILYYLYLKNVSNKLGFNSRGSYIQIPGALAPIAGEQNSNSWDYLQHYALGTDTQIGNYYDSENNINYKDLVIRFNENGNWTYNAFNVNENKNESKSGDGEYLRKTRDYAEKISNANGYKVEKVKTTPKVQQVIEDNNEYKCVVGPFKIDYAGTTIDNITGLVNDKTTIQGNNLEWAKTYNSTKWKNCDSNKNLPKNEEFYIKFKCESNYTKFKLNVKFKEFEYYNVRFVTAASPNGLNQASILWGIKTQKINDKVDWTIDLNLTTSLKIKKVDYRDTSKKLDAKFAIFYKKYTNIDSSEDGWLGYNKTKNIVTYGKAWANATKFRTGEDDGTIILNNLQYGNYYVIEVEAPKGYKLSDQAGYKQDSNYSFLTKQNWKMDEKESCIIGNNSEKNGYLKVSKPDGSDTSLNNNNYINLTYTSSNKPYTYLVKNKKETSLKIKKVDKETGKALQGAGFKILVKNAENNSWGWLQSDGRIIDLTQEKSDLKTNSKGIIEIKNVPYGKYYIYETESPDPNKYKLNEQEPKNRFNYSAIPKGYPGDMVKQDYFYHWNYTINQENNTLDLEIKNADTSSPPNSLEIIKKDKDTGEPLSDVGFKVLVNTGTEIGWLQRNGKLSTELTDSKSDLYTDEDGIINLVDVPSGRYYIYETEPKEGYNLQEQSTNDVYLNGTPLGDRERWI